MKAAINILAVKPFETVMVMATQNKIKSNWIDQPSYNANLAPSNSANLLRKASREETSARPGDTRDKGEMSAAPHLIVIDLCVPGDHDPLLDTGLWDASFHSLQGEHSLATNRHALQRYASVPKTVEVDEVA